MNNNNKNITIYTNDKINNNLHPLVSVITVCLNSKKYIEKTITSVINQTYRELEYIIVDGSSNDGTLDIIKKYDSNINCWVSEPDEGIYDAMNKGIKLSSGDWLTFLNSGDRFNNDTVIEKVVEVCNKDKTRLDTISFIYGNAIYEDAQTGLRFRKGKEIKGIKDFYFSIRNIGLNPICHQTVFFRRYLFNKIGFYNKKLKIIGDYEWFIRFFTSKEKYVLEYINSDLVYFQMGGLSFKYLGESLIESNNVIKKYFPFPNFILFKIFLPFLYLKYKLTILIGDTALFKIYRILKYRILNKSKGNINYS